MTIRENQLNTPYTVAEQSKLNGIATNAEVNPDLANQAVAEAGLDNSQYMTALRVAQAISVQVSVGGDINTASNEGTGTGLFIQKTGSNLEFKSVSAGTGVTLGGDAQNIIINASAGGLTDTDGLNEGLSNFYYTEARVNLNASVVANTAKISADGSVTTHSDVTVTGPANGEVMTYQGGVWINAAATGGGAALTAQDEGITLDSAVTILNFIGSGVTSVQNGAGVIDITIPGGGGGGAINDLTDVTVTTPSNGQVLTYQGGTWINSTSGSSSSPTVIIKLGAGATIADKVTNAPVGGIPAGYTIVDGANGSVHASLTGSTDDIVVIHSTGTFAVRPGVASEDTLFGGFFNRELSSGDLKTDNGSQDQFKISSYNTLAGTGLSFITIDLV